MQLLVAEPAAARRVQFDHDLGNDLTLAAEQIQELEITHGVRRQGLEELAHAGVAMAGGEVVSRVR